MNRPRRKTLKNRSLICLVTVLACVMLASSAFAWQSVRTGKKDFERGWRAYLSKQPQKAAGYFAESADAFGQALAEDPPSRTAMFASNLTMAGMSMYFAGRYEKSVSIMQMVAEDDDSIWESYIMAALSQGRLGHADSMEEGLDAYLDAAPAQSVLSNMVQKQQTALEKGETTPENAVAAIEKSMRKQFVKNYTFSRRSIHEGKEHCSGSFWWRYYKAPCSRYDVYYDN